MRCRNRAVRKRVAIGLISLCLTVLLGWMSPFPMAATQSPSPQLIQADLQTKAAQLFRRGVEQSQASQFEAAVQSWRQALSRFRLLQDAQNELTTLSRLTAACLQMGDYRQALTYSQQAQSLAETLADPAAAMRALGNRAIAYRSLGQYPQAVTAYQQALDRLSPVAADDPSNPTWQTLEGQLLVNLGNVYESLGEYAQAIEHYQASLALMQGQDALAHRATLLSNLGAVHAQMGAYDQAIACYQQSLAIARDLGDAIMTGYALNNLGAAYHSQQALEPAIEAYQQSLQLAHQSQSAGLEATALGSLGLAYEDLGEFDRAIDLHRQSLALAKRMREPSMEGKTRNNLGHALFQAGRLVEAEAQLRRAVDVLESLRPGLSDAQNVSLFDTHVLTYNLLQQVLVAQNQVEAALEVAERGRAQAFVELLANRSVSPLGEPLRPQPPSLAEIRTVAQKRQATLVEYSLVPDDGFKVQGKLRGQAETLYIWVVSPRGDITFRQVDLKPLRQTQGLTVNQLVTQLRQDIILPVPGLSIPPRGPDARRIQPGDCVRQTGDPTHWSPYRVVAVDPAAGTVTLSHPQFTLPNPTVPTSQISPVAGGRCGQVPPAQQLYQILIDPIADLLPAQTEAPVIFMPQDQLFLVPFPALQDARGEYFIQQHTLLTAPSIQALALVQDRQNPTDETSPDSLIPALVVGNPSPMPEDLRPLPAAEIEARQVAQQLAVSPLIGADATEAAVRQRLPAARLIHLATHGFFNETHPLQGRIALAQGGQDQDGFLTAEEILGTVLTADLVVLSACDTGRGQITGDGVIGLSRSLLAVGAKQVIVSLWQVPDEATAYLMTRFYQALQATSDPAQALHQAMQATSRTFPDPRSWAAFTLIQ